MAVPEDDQLSTLLHYRAELSPLPTATFALLALEGPDAGQRFVVDGSRTSYLLGQGPLDFRVSDREASRRHLELELAGARLRVRDVGSTNGTFVDRLFVIEALLDGGETVRVGTTVFRVERTNGCPDIAASFSAGFGHVVGASREMRRLYPLCERLAESTVPVIIEGETGTGKEVLAESVHETGSRAAGPFVVFDCTAVPPSLAEAQLFGHERGAFTGALTSHKGVFELASGGTLFIDEIGDLDIAIQAKLLRAVDRSEIRRVGGETWLHVDTRVLCATRRDLDHEVQSGRFRDDLLHRLAVGRIKLPPLRRRKGDVPLLVDHFCRGLDADPTTFPKPLLRQWEESDWPGNVRELRNAILRQVTLGGLVTDHGDDEVTPVPSSANPISHIIGLKLPFPRARRLLLSEFERRYVQAVLDLHGGNVVHAARASGIARRYFQMLRTRSRE